MSEMQKFYERVAKNGVLQAKFSQIMKLAEQDGKEATEEKLIAFAKEEGFDISIPEMREFFEDMAETEEGELSDAELDMVAGGKSMDGSDWDPITGELLTSTLMRGPGGMRIVCNR